MKVRRKFASGPLDEITDEALSACDSMMRDLTDVQVENQGLRAELRAEADAWEHLFESMPTPCLLTTADAVILKANGAAGELLNVSPKRLKERALLLFTEDRRRLADILTALGTVTQTMTATLTMRPKERRPVASSVTVTAATRDQQTAWIWFLVPCEESRPSRQQRREISLPEPGEAAETPTALPDC